MVVLYFFIIALMNVTGSNFNRRASRLIDGNSKLFHYLAYYNLVATVAGLIGVAAVGFYGFDTFTLLCSISLGVLLVIDQFAKLFTVRVCTLPLMTTFSTAGTIIPCIVGVFLFNEPMSVWQWIGIAAFILAAFLMISGSKASFGKITLKSFLLLFVMFVCAGVEALVQKLFAVKKPDGNVFLFSMLSFAVNAVLLYGVTLFSAIGKKDTLRLLDKKLYAYGAVLAISLLVVSTLVTIIARTVPSGVLFPITSTLSFAASMAVGAIAFKEKITVQNVTGMALAIGAIVIISLL